MGGRGGGGGGGEGGYCSPQQALAGLVLGTAASRETKGLGEGEEVPPPPPVQAWDRTDSALGGIAGPPPCTPHQAGRRQLRLCAHLPWSVLGIWGLRVAWLSAPLASPSFLRSPADRKSLAPAPSPGRSSGPPSPAPPGGWPVSPEAPRTTPAAAELCAPAAAASARPPRLSRRGRGGAPLPAPAPSAARREVPQSDRGAENPRPLPSGFPRDSARRPLPRLRKSCERRPKLLPPAPRRARPGRPRARPPLPPPGPGAMTRGAQRGPGGGAEAAERGVGGGTGRTCAGRGAAPGRGQLTCWR